MSDAPLPQWGTLQAYTVQSQQAELGLRPAFSSLLMVHNTIRRSGHPRPSRHYQEQQRETRRLLDLPIAMHYIALLSLQAQLEAEFVQAWGFTLDLDGRALELKQLAAQTCRGFDHCTCYSEPRTGAHIVVTQPYLPTEQAVQILTERLTIVPWLRPEIIPAPEWAFYYPGWATLTIVKFPEGYEKLMKPWSRLWSEAAEAALNLN